MEHIGRGGVSPAEVAPAIALWVILVVEVICAVEINHAVRVIDPVLCRSKEYLRPVLLIAAVGLFSWLFGSRLFCLWLVDERIIILLDVIVGTSGDGSRNCSGCHHGDVFSYIHILFILS